MREVQGLVLLLQDDPALNAAVRESLSRTSDGGPRLQCIRSLPTALARIAGGGVDAVLIDVSHGWGSQDEALDAVLQVRRYAPQAVIMALHATADESLAAQALSAGATGHVNRERCAETLLPALRKALGLDPESAAALKPGRILALLGAKGGVGATTVALNLACLLARRSKVILAEIRPEFGTLASYFAPHGLVRNLTHALRGDPAQGCLWSSKMIPGLSVLFGPQAATECGPLAPDQVRILTTSLATLADYVVVDLPGSLSYANRAVVEISETIMLVVERDVACVQLARLTTHAIEQWSGAPQPIETVLVNRAALVSPMPLPDIDAQLGRAPLAVIPPGSDLCAAAQNAHLPLVILQPESLLAESFVMLSQKLGPSPGVPLPRASRLVSGKEPLHV